MPTETYYPTATPTPAPTINDPGKIEKIWFTLVDTNRVDVAWEMPTGYDDEGLRIKKYEIELRLLRTHVATYVTTDLDNLAHSFTGLECNKEYRVRVRAWNMYGFDEDSLDPTTRARTANSAKWPRIEDPAAGPWGYSPFRKTRGCPLPSAPSDVTVTGVNKAGLMIKWTSPPETEEWGNNVGYFAIRFRPKYSVGAEWSTAKAAPTDSKKYLWTERHGTECGLTYDVELRTVGSKHNKGPWIAAVGSTLAC